MLFRQLIFAASAAAMLVVPETSDSEDGIFRTLPHDVKTYDIPTTAFTQSIEVPCAECRGHDAHLKMDFAVEDNTRLLLNGFELYPNADPWQGDLSASVIKGNGKSQDRRLGYGLSVRPEGMDEDQRLEVIAVELLVIEVGDRFVDGVPLVKVKLVKSAGGEILIGSINIVKSERLAVPNQCSSMWCRVEGMIDDAWKSVKSTFKSKGCSGMRGHGHGRKAQHHGHGKTEETSSDHDGHNSHNGHGHNGSFEHKPHHHRHSWGMLKYITSYIFLPVLMGITAGVGVAMYVFFTQSSHSNVLINSSLAMFIGTLAIRVIRLVRGERHEAPMYVDCDHKIDIIEFISADEEKAGLIIHQEAAPEYESEDEAPQN